MKKTGPKIIGVIVIVLVLVVIYAVFHKPMKMMPSASTTSSTSTTQSTAINNAVLVTKSNSSVGQYLANPSGDTLYTYSGDSTGVSNCSGSCLSNWPAYQDKGSTSGLPTNVSTIKRSDNGEIQYTYKGLPLYTFIGDSQGQITGNGVSSFYVAKP